MRDGALHQQARLERGIVLVARHDERRHRRCRHLRFQVVERRAGAPGSRAWCWPSRAPNARLRWRMYRSKPRGSLRCNCRRVASVAVGGGELRHALLQHHLGVRARGRAGTPPVCAGMRAVAAAGDDQAQGARAVLHAEMQRGEAAHRQAHDVGALDASARPSPRGRRRARAPASSARRSRARPRAGSRARCRRCSGSGARSGESCGSQLRRSPANSCTKTIGVPRPASS